MHIDLAALGSRAADHRLCLHLQLHLLPAVVGAGARTRPGTIRDVLLSPGRSGRAERSPRTRASALRGTRQGGSTDAFEGDPRDIAGAKFE